MDVKEEDILGSGIYSHWYYVSKGRALRQFIRGIKTVGMLDIGAGSGIFSRQLLDAGICDTATCVDPAYAEERVENHNGKDIQFVRSVEQSPHKLILMMDVLEHVDDDVGLLRQYSDTMPRDGHVLISVPAFQFLWSGHDEFLEHRRRYTRETITRVVRDAGLHVVQCRYFFGLLFPLVAAIRLRGKNRLKDGRYEPQSDLRMHSTQLNTGLILIHDIERVTLFPFNRFAGLTVFCLARPI
ncbi:class I SAM-dependent methyltransferase [Pseudomonadota bacterium]